MNVKFRQDVTTAINVNNGLHTRIDLLKGAITVFEKREDHTNLALVAQGCLDLYKFIMGEAANVS